MFSSEIDRTRPATVLRLDGELRMRTVAQVRNALLKCLVECPEAVVVDLSCLQIGSRTALTVFGAVSHRATEWPPVPLILVATPPDLRQQLRQVTQLWRIPVFSTVDEALAVAPVVPLTPRRVKRTMRPGTMSLPQVRAMASDACLAWGLDDFALPAELILSELVSNSIQHAGTDFTVGLVFRYDLLHLTVADGSPDPPRKSPSYPPVGALSGRGLLLVDEFASAWGCLPLQSGKVVWATLRVGR
ncbi:STAS domain-containing protein [Cryptosporangium aurantiacum]|uniref:STAS domain-containing protein n=1 Tax=Cryptosporangium aurantiacum TaxID=134849 RepID=A0A1M7RPE9_9ACTN|nr:STAS domain-containing protein [Cryptosporangium aurantiacum]SHN48041.1 STAS domain-containing protein [Cryptosporangium aurantiacum]